MKILQILGCRPTLVKFINITGKDYVLWTGQHYDENLMARDVLMSQVGNHQELGAMTSEAYLAIKKQQPNLVVVYGDTRSALAGALAADQCNIPLAHIEAGVRLDDIKRPEERIRKLIDNISDYLFCVNDLHAENLERENVSGQIFIVGDLHYDRYLRSRPHKGYILATIHRAENTDRGAALKAALLKLEREECVIFLVHPKTKKAMDEFKLKPPGNVKVISPVQYNEMQELIREAKLVITDSGGVAREAWFAGAPVEFIGPSEWDFELRMFGDGNAEGKIRKILLEELKKVI